MPNIDLANVLSLLAITGCVIQFKNIFWYLQNIQLRVNAN